MKLRSLWITSTAVAFMAAALPAAAASAPAKPTFTITGTTDSSVTIEWTDHSTNEVGFKVQMRRPPDDWTDVLDLRDHRAGQPEATGWTYSHTFNVAISPQVRGVCLRVKAYNDDGSSDWTKHLCTMPDLAGTGIVAPPTVKANTSFLVSFAACNFSTVATGRFTVHGHAGNRIVFVTTVPGFGPNECRAGSFSVPFGLPQGSHLIAVRLDALEEVAEAAEDNNIGFRSITVTAA